LSRGPKLLVWNHDQALSRPVCPIIAGTRRIVILYRRVADPVLA
jgi:hypothetical protein